MGNRHVTDGSLDFGQRKDVLHQLRHFGACEIFDLRGKALNRAAQIAKAVGALGAFAFLQILLSWSRVFGFIFRDLLFENGDKKRPSTFRTLRPVNGLIFGIRFFKLAGGEQHFMLFTDGKSTRDRRTSVARECSSLDGTK